MIGVRQPHSRGSWMGPGLRGTMNLRLWLLYFLPVSGSLKVLPEVRLDVESGGSIYIECPLPQTHVRMYLCRQMTNPAICTTVVSSIFVKKEYKGRVTLKPFLDKQLFLVEMTQLTEEDSGDYACGVGANTDLGKTQKVTLNVHNVPRTLKVLPEVRLDVESGGSIYIECPLPQTHVRMYLCRQMTNPAICTTVVSSVFVKKEYKGRVTLKPFLDKQLFLVEMTQLTEEDSGDYACGVGANTDLGKTQKVTLNVHNGHPEYPEPFWGDEWTSETPPGWLLHSLLEEPIPWLDMGEHASPSGFIDKVTTPSPKTEAPPVHQPSSIASVTRHPRVYRASSETATKSSALLPATTASKTSAQQASGLLQASYSHHTGLHEQRTLHHRYTREDRGLLISIPEFHILIPTFLGFLLLVLLGLVVKRVIQRRRAFSRRVGRMTRRMGGRGPSRQINAQRRDAQQRPRSQNNVYSACPRRAREPDNVGSAEAPLLNAPASAPPALPQVLETSWPHSLKMSCEYVSLGHQPGVNVEDHDSNDYINIPGPPHLPSKPPGPRPSCQ